MPEAAEHVSRRIGLRARVTIAFAGLALLLSATLAVFAYELTRSFLIDRREQSAEQEAFLNARAVRDALRVNALDVSGALRQAQVGSDSSVVLRVGSQWFGTSVGVGRADVPIALRKLVAGGAVGTQNTELGSSPNIGVGVPLPAVDGAFFEFTPAKDLDQTLSLLARALTAAALVATILGAVTGRYASGRVLRPVRRMATTASEIADGDLDERLDADGDADLEPLVDAFNSMVRALRIRIDREARFASNVSHELRTPIATMTAALNVARRRGSGEAAEGALDLLDQELQKFRQLVVDLLEVSRMEGGVATIELERVDPAALVREVLRSTERTSVAVDVEGAAPPVCRIDRRRIAQVLTNLLDNADAYGDGATRVVVSGTGQSVLIAVDDAGPGVAPEERLHVFERFARGEASESKPGTGLGLALVVEHVRLHDGRVWVDDSPDGGARFVVELPRDTE